MLKVNEMFASIQGEGGRSGEATFFIRLSGCNLRCDFCDTQYAFVDGYILTEQEIIESAKQSNLKWVCLTGGEPLMQDINPLIALLKADGFQIAIETNGTYKIPSGIDYVTVSPKRSINTVAEFANEWKYIIEDGSDFDRIGQTENVYLQPVDNNVKIARLCVDKILENQGWRLSLQLHKLIKVK
jgi:7-carboxy-7-deazaguanine synthase